MFRLINALAILGRRIIVNTLFGQNPRVSLKKVASSAISGLVSAARGVTSGIIFFSFLWNLDLLVYLIIDNAIALSLSEHHPACDNNSNTHCSYY